MYAGFTTGICGINDDDSSWKNCPGITDVPATVGATPGVPWIIPCGGAIAIPCEYGIIGGIGNPPPPNGGQKPGPGITGVTGTQYSWGISQGAS
ncbi:hypothetical protein [Neobacillus drentensis]|uniref:hypothetical protein n=1 Tax=Neobacillus drentensis TaxID=220684 RepID=UPI003B58AB2F